VHRILYGAFFWIVVIVCGCGVKNDVSGFAAEPFPYSNRYGAERALAEAIAGIDLSFYRGYEVSVATEAAGEAGDIAVLVVQEALVEKGIRVVGESAAVGVTVTVDSLAVVVRRAENGKRMLERVATASVTVVVAQNDTRRVFRGEGMLADTIPAGMAAGLDFGHDYAVNETEGNALVNWIKPFAVAAALTVYGWLLYSYRG